MSQASRDSDIIPKISDSAGSVSRVRLIAHKLFMETDIGGTIYGNSGNDYLWTFDSGRLDGGADNDVLEAPQGADMTGGGGADQFICNGGVENILDYDPAEGDSLVNPMLCDNVA